MNGFPDFLDVSRTAEPRDGTGCTRDAGGDVGRNKAVQRTIGIQVLEFDLRDVATAEQRGVAQVVNTPRNVRFSG